MGNINFTFNTSFYHVSFHALPLLVLFLSFPFLPFSLSLSLSLPLSLSLSLPPSLFPTLSLLLRMIQSRVGIFSMRNTLLWLAIALEMTVSLLFLVQHSNTFKRERERERERSKNNTYLMPVL